MLAQKQQSYKEMTFPPAEVASRREKEAARKASAPGTLAVPLTKGVVELVEGKDRGIVATEVIEEGELIEKCPELSLTENDEKHVKDKAAGGEEGGLERYVSDEGPLRGGLNLMLGYGSLYNHDGDDPNAEKMNAREPGTCKFVALRRIEPGEEIVYDYGFFGDDVFSDLA